MCMTNIVDPDQMPHSVASDLGLPCLLRHLFQSLRLLRFYNTVYENCNVNLPLEHLLTMTVQVTCPDMDCLC